MVFVQRVVVIWGAFVCRFHCISFQIAEENSVDKTVPTRTGHLICNVDSVCEDHHNDCDVVRASWWSLYTGCD